MTWETSEMQAAPQPDTKLNFKLDLVCPRSAAHTSNILAWASFYRMLVLYNIKIHK